MAILPVSDVIAATVKGHFSLEKAADAVNTNDSRLVFEAAGLEGTDPVLATLLEGIYHTYYQQYDISGGIDDSEKGLGQDINDLVNNYKASVARLQRAIDDLDENSTVEEVHAVLTAFKDTSLSSANSTNSSLVNATLLMAGVFAAANRRFTFDSDSIFRDKVEGIDPLTKQPFYQEIPGQSLDQSLANVFYGIFQNLNQTLVKLNDHLSSSNDDAKNKAEQAREYAANKKLICSTAANLDPVVSCDNFEKMLSASTDKKGNSCSNQSTTLTRVSCTQAWYVRQQGLLSDARNAVAAINTAVSSDEKAIVGVQQKYVNKITNSDVGSIADITKSYNAGVAAINGAYAVLGSTVSTNVTAVNAKLSEVDTDFFESDITTINNSLKSAKAAADKAFPTGLNADNVSTTYASSVPGKAIAALGTAQSAITGPINNANSVATALNAAVSKVKGIIDADVASAKKAIKNVTSVLGMKGVPQVNAAAQKGISAINSDYTTAMGTKVAPGSVSQAIAAAQSAKTALATLQKTYTKLVDIGVALKAVNAAINAANIAFPAGLPVLSSENASKYKASYPGGAVDSIVSAQHSTNKTTVIGAAATAILAVILAALTTALYKGLRKTPQEVEDDLEPLAEGIAEKMSSGDQKTVEAEADKLKEKAGVSDDASATDIADGLANNGVSTDEVTEISPTIVDAVGHSELNTHLTEMFLEGNVEGSPTSEESEFVDQLVADHPEIQDDHFGILKSSSSFGQLEGIKEASNVKMPEIMQASTEGMPEGFDGNMFKRVQLVEKTLKANPDLVQKDGSIDMTEFKQKAAEAIFSEGTSTDTGSSGFTTGSGGTGEDADSDSVFGEVAGSSKADTESGIESKIEQEKLTKSQFEEQVAELQDKVEDEEKDESTLSDQGKEQLADDKAELDAAKSAEDDPTVHFDEPV